MRTNDSSPHPQRWSNVKLMREAHAHANLDTFSGSLPDGQYVGGFPRDHGDAIREATRLYRQSWLNPILAEIERRFVKVKK